MPDALIAVDPDDLTEAMERARAHAPFLAHLLDQEPALARGFAQGQLPDPASLWGEGDDLPVAQSLRLARRRLALVVAIGDLAGAFDLTAVTGACRALPIMRSTGRSAPRLPNAHRVPNQRVLPRSRSASKAVLS